MTPFTLGLEPDGVAKTLIVKTLERYLRAVVPASGRLADRKTRNRLAPSHRPQRGIQAHSDSVDVLLQWTNAECGLGVCGTDDGSPTAPSLS